jgi:hypothetical protein
MVFYGRTFFGKEGGASPDTIFVVVYVGAHAHDKRFNSRLP